MYGRCLMVANGYFDNAATVSQRSELAKKLEKRGFQTVTARSNSALAMIDGGNAVSKAKDFDFCVYLDKDVATALLLEKTGLRLFNRAEAIRVCDDKMLTYIALAGKGLKMPKTIASPLMYADCDDPAFLDEVERELGYPIVVKKAFGSMGKGVFLAEDRAALDALFAALRREPHVYQEFVGKRGEDVRVITVGGKAVAAMRRKNKGDFRSNIECGGAGEKIDLDETKKNIAEKASRELGLDYAGVDILGDDVLCEVNSNAFFMGIERVTGIDVAGIYADYIVKEIGRK